MDNRASDNPDSTVFLCSLNESYAKEKMFLNEECAGLRPACAWFLKIDPVRIVSMHVCVCVCACVCVHPEAIITSGAIWTPYSWLNKFYSCYMAIVVIIINGRGLSIDMRHRH